MKQFNVPQFYKLFTELDIWKFQVPIYVLILNKFYTTLYLQFVEEFLNNFFMVKSVSLKDASWKLLLKKISDKFVTVAYKVQLNFTLTL